MKICWISAGISSFIAGYFSRDTVDKYIYIDVKDQHPDSLRFIRDCEKLLGKRIEIIRSCKYLDVEDVARRTGFLNSPYGAPCTGMLKMAVRKEWESEYYQQSGKIDLEYVWGYDVTERRRAAHMIENFPEFKHEFPLIDRNLRKEDAHALAMKLGLRRPLMYDLGYSNNNCIGCVKGGKGYWNKIRKDFPDVFQRRAKLERDLGCSCINGCFLDELDPNDGRGGVVVPECSVFCYLAEQEGA